MLTTPNRGLIQALQQYLHGLHEQKFNLQQMAQHFALDKYQLIRHFKQQVGVTHNVYLTLLRVELAKNLLAQGHSLVEVALEAGFYDQSHLTRHFRTYTGITPGNYQRNYPTVQE